MIIDTHTHIGTMLNFDMREEHITYMMKEYGIDHCIVSNSECATHDHFQNPIPKEYIKSHIDTNQRVIEFARKNEGKISVALWVNPYDDPQPIEKMIIDNRNIICAIKFHPFHSALRFDSKEIDNYIKLANKYQLTVVTHTGDGECDGVRLVYEVAQKYPDVNFVMVHMGLGTDNNEAIDLISKLPNLYGDTTWVSIKSTLRFLICSQTARLFWMLICTVLGLKLPTASQIVLLGCILDMSCALCSLASVGKQATGEGRKTRAIPDSVGEMLIPCVTGTLIAALSVASPFIYKLVMSLGMREAAMTDETLSTLIFAGILFALPVVFVEMASVSGLFAKASSLSPILFIPLGISALAAALSFTFGGLGEALSLTFPGFIALAFSLIPLLVSVVFLAAYRAYVNKKYKS